MNQDCHKQPVTERRRASVSMRCSVYEQFFQWRLMLASERGLMGWAALEASLPMLPVEFVLIPLTRLRPSKAAYLAVLATVFSAVGAVYSYALGSSGESILHWDAVQRTGPWLSYLISGLDRWGEGLVLFAAVLPAPLSIVSMGAGLLHIGLIPFLLTVFFARGLRFYLVTSLTVHFNSGKKECPYRRLRSVFRQNTRG